MNLQESVNDHLVERRVRLQEGITIQTLKKGLSKEIAGVAKRLPGNLGKTYRRLANSVAAKKVRRERLRLKMGYGGAKSTANRAELRNKIKNVASQEMKADKVLVSWLKKNKLPIELSNL